jgi:sulfur-carrier protein
MSRPTDTAQTTGAASERVTSVRVTLPAHLRTIAKVGGEVRVEVDGAVTQRAVLDALESAYPNLKGTIRDQTTFKRRAFVRFYACEEDISHDAPDDPLPDDVVIGKEPFMVIGAMAGG